MFSQSAIEQLAEAIAKKMTDSGHLKQRVLTLREACDYTGLSEHAMRHKVAERKLPTVGLDRKLRFDRVDLDRWIDDNRRLED